MDINVTPRRRRRWDIHLAPFIRYPLIILFCVIIATVFFKFGKWFFTQWLTQAGLLGC